MPGREYPLASANARIADLETGLRFITERVDSLDVELGGVPRLSSRDPKRPTVDDRLSALEGETATARAIADYAKAVRGHAWTVREKAALFGVALAGVLIALAGLVLRLIS